MNIRKGTIVMLRGSWCSGLATLIVDEETPKAEVKTRRIAIACENGPTVRALDGAFGDVIGEGHTINNRVLEGKEIYFTTDDLGMLQGFTPATEAPPDTVRMYEEGIR